MNRMHNILFSPTIPTSIENVSAGFTVQNETTACNLFGSLGNRICAQEPDKTHRAYPIDQSNYYQPRTRIKLRCHIAASGVLLHSSDEARGESTLPRSSVEKMR